MNYPPVALQTRTGWHFGVSEESQWELDTPGLKNDHRNPCCAESLQWLLMMVLFPVFFWQLSNKKSKVKARPERQMDDATAASSVGFGLLSWVVLFCPPSPLPFPPCSLSI